MKEALKLLIYQYESIIKYLKIEIKTAPPNIAATMAGSISAFNKVIRELKSLSKVIEDNLVEKEFVEKLLKEFGEPDSFKNWYEHYKKGNLK